MNVLILSCSVGGGHDAAGRAVQEALERRGHGVTMMNPYTLRGEKLSHCIDQTYIRTVQKAPKVFGAVYQLGDWYCRHSWKSPMYRANRGMADVMADYFAAHPTDVVIVTHFFGGEILAAMREQGRKVPKTIFIVTDYTCTPFTEESDSDAYVIPSESLAEEFTCRGIPAERLHPLGIPTRSAFAEAISQQEARRALGLKEDGKYVLVAGGSMGGGNIGQAIDLLQQELSGSGLAELIVICGTNQHLFTRLTEQYGGAMRILGHTDQMALYLKAADLFVTKPGGLSSTEAAVAGIPILHTCAIPGCETCNARYFSGHGMSVSCEISRETLPQVRKLLTDEQAVLEMKENQKRYLEEDSASRICDLAERLAQKEAVVL